jgi:hypothetical protein
VVDEAEKSCTTASIAISPLVVVTVRDGFVPERPVADCGDAALNVVVWSTPS